MPGYAKLQSNEIYLNHVLFAQHPEYYMSDVIPHEIATFDLFYVIWTGQATR